MKKIITVLMMSLLFVPAVLGQTKKEKKEMLETEEYKKMLELIESEKYDFEADWANAQQGGRINLTTNPNFIKINKDSANIFLPYFGNLYSGTSAITGNSGIEFEGLMKDYTMTADDNKKKISVTFSAISKNEQYDFTLSFFKNGKTLVNVNSNYRSNIKYDGMTKKPKPKE
ncbi:DUF4251 domain-containing protein [Lutimonas vermicola]|uniref:DUF4251 domain-containing protein n=1 Tax=Lutimonas vermicola TaxID=414288 RepID=A0ABU9L4B0_9FLAO